MSEIVTRLSMCNIPRRFHERGSEQPLLYTDVSGTPREIVQCPGFDFGDDWWHQISVVAIHEGPGSGKYPRVTARTGESPPQYPDFDDEYEDDDGDGEDCDEG